MKWFKSSYSSSQGACVEVKMSENGVMVRDSKDREGPILSFSQGSWRQFIQEIGECEIPKVV